MNRITALGMSVLALAMIACLPFFGTPEIPDADVPNVHEPASRQDAPAIPESAREAGSGARDTTKRETESVPTATMKIETAKGNHQSLEAFGACINHYHRELRFAPWDTEITVKDGIVWGQFGRGFGDGDRDVWVETLPVALCLDYAPTPSRDELSAKCVIETAEWYLREYPDIKYAVGPFALVSCLPPYDG